MLSSKKPTAVSYSACRFAACLLCCCAECSWAVCSHGHSSNPTLQVPASHHGLWNSGVARPSTTIAADSTAASTGPRAAVQQIASEALPVSTSLLSHGNADMEHHRKKSAREAANSTTTGHVTKTERHASTSIPYEHVQKLLLHLRHSLGLNIMQQMRLDMQRVRLYLGSRAFRLHQQQQQPQPSRGILIPAGGHDMLANAFITTRMLREVLDCTLPVEVVHFGTAEREPAVAQLIDGGVTLPDGLPRLQVPLHRRQAQILGFGHKVYALAFVTSFDQVCCLISDNARVGMPAYR